nr:MAG TPA: hypothetical protein [Bacteriophage sp.]
MFKALCDLHYDRLLPVNTLLLFWSLFLNYT